MYNAHRCLSSGTPAPALKSVAAKHRSTTIKHQDAVIAGLRSKVQELQKQREEESERNRNLLATSGLKTLLQSSNLAPRTAGMVKKGVALMHEHTDESGAVVHPGLPAAERAPEYTEIEEGHDDEGAQSSKKRRKSQSHELWRQRQNVRDEDLDAAKEVLYARGGGNSNKTGEIFLGLARGAFRNLVQELPEGQVAHNVKSFLNNPQFVSKGPRLKDEQQLMDAVRVAVVPPEPQAKAGEVQGIAAVLGQNHRPMHVAAERRSHGEQYFFSHSQRQRRYDHRDGLRYLIQDLSHDEEISRLDSNSKRKMVQGPNGVEYHDRHTRLVAKEMAAKYIRSHPSFLFWMSQNKRRHGPRRGEPLDVSDAFIVECLCKCLQEEGFRECADEIKSADGRVSQSAKAEPP